MKLTTNSTDLQKLNNTTKKAERLCKLYKCSVLDLMVFSLQVERENKIEQLKKNLK